MVWPPAWLAVLGGFGAATLLARRLSPQIYDLVILHMTETWYRSVLERVPAGSRVLDIGIGTASALLRNKKLIVEKRLQVVGVDYDATYVAQATKNVAHAGLSGQVRVIHASVYDTDLRERTGCPFDVAYFSGSFSLLPQPDKVSQPRG
jgi:ubiquinone/menaquinone biosynthesis C-methylase UbiE